MATHSRHQLSPLSLLRCLPWAVSIAQSLMLLWRQKRRKLLSLFSQGYRYRTLYRAEERTAVSPKTQLFLNGWHEQTITSVSVRCLPREVRYLRQHFVMLIDFERNMSRSACAFGSHLRRPFVSEKHQIT